MWWLEPRDEIHRIARFAVVLAMAGLVAGCFQPLYASRTASGGPAVLDQLKSVEVAPIPNAPRGTPVGRIAAELRDALISDLTGSSAAYTPAYRLLINVSASQQQLIVDITTSRPDVEQATLDATYSLVEIASGKVVVTGRTFSRVSYDNPGQEQRFARARGRRDAESRAAKVMSEDIRSRLASYFVAGT